VSLALLEARPLAMGPVHTEGDSLMTVRTQIKGGKIAANHNARILEGRSLSEKKSLNVRTLLKAGRLAGNHNVTIQNR
jgi:hypothetical protein